jgi:hypothetical protein
MQTFIDDPQVAAQHWTPAFSQYFLAANQDGDYDDFFNEVFPAIRSQRLGHSAGHAGDVGGAVDIGTPNFSDQALQQIPADLQLIMKSIKARKSSQAASSK